MKLRTDPASIWVSGHVWTAAGQAVTLREDVNLLNANYLVASVVWSSIGLGYFIYGKRQQSFVPMIAGLVMIGLSYLVGSALVMTLLCGATVAAVYLLLRRGF